MARLLFLFMIVPFLMAALQGATPSGKGKLVGKISFRPSAPAETPEQVPPRVSYSGLSVLITAPGPQSGQLRSALQRVVATAPVGKSGSYSATLPAGQYVLTVRGPGVIPWRSPQRRVMVAAGKTTRADLEVDTGLR